MAILPLVPFRQNITLQSSNVVYTVPSTVGGFPITEALLTDITVTLICQPPIECIANIYITNLSGNFPIVNANYLTNKTYYTETDLWSIGKYQRNTPVTFISEAIPLEPDDEIEVGLIPLSANDLIPNTVEIASVVGTIQLVNNQ